MLNNSVFWIHSIPMYLHWKTTAAHRKNTLFLFNITPSCPHGSHCRWAMRPVVAAVNTTAEAQADTSQCITAGSWFRLADPHTFGSCRGNKTQIPRQRAVISHYNVNTTILKHFYLLTIPNSWVPQLLQLLITSCIGTKTSGKWRDFRVNCLTHRYFLFWSAI